MYLSPDQGPKAQAHNSQNKSPDMQAGNGDSGRTALNGMAKE